MAIKMYPLPERSHFETLRERWIKMNRQWGEWLSIGKGDAQACYRQLCQNAVDLACIALILGEGDDEALKQFEAAAGHAIRWLEAPASKGAPRVYDVRAETTESEVRVTAIHEVRPERSGARLSIVAYWRILSVTVAFGDEAGMEKVARCPEGDYSSPDIATEPCDYAQLRAWKAWILGDREAARRETASALRGATGPWPLLKAFIAMVTKDAGEFGRQIAAELQRHKKSYQGKRHMPEGFVDLGALALCRLALEEGIRVDDGPYLPVRLLPNYRPVVH